MSKQLKILFVSVFFIWSISQSLGACPNGPVTVDGTFDNGARWIISIPENWNGIMVYYIRGFSEAIPPIDQIFNYNYGGAFTLVLDLKSVLESNSFGIAATDWGTPADVRSGISSTVKLAKEVIKRFCRPQKSIILAKSLGGLVAYLISQNPYNSQFFDGIVITCGIPSLPKVIDLSLNFAFAFDAVIGWPSKFGPIGQPFSNFTLNDIYFTLLLYFFDNAHGKELEFIRVYFQIDPRAFFFAIDLQTLFYEVYGATIATAVFEKYAGGTISSTANLQDVTLSPQSLEDLVTLGWNRSELLEKVAEVNNAVFIPQCQSRSKVLAYEIKNPGNLPTITLHNPQDTFVPSFLLSFTADVYRQRGKEDHLLQAWVSTFDLYGNGNYLDSVGHCLFDSNQILTVLQAMVNWTQSGVKPDIEFPSNLGFTSFEPISWREYFKK